MRAGASLPVVPRIDSGTAPFTSVRRMDAPPQTVPRSRFALRLERDLGDDAEAGSQSPSLQRLPERRIERVVRLSSEEKSIWRIARGRRAYGLWLEIRSF
jgi:hypothetical protein